MMSARKTVAGGRVVHPAIAAGLTTAQRKCFDYFCLGGGQAFFAQDTRDALLEKNLLVRVSGFMPPQYAVPDAIHKTWIEFIAAANDDNLAGGRR